MGPHEKSPVVTGTAGGPHMCLLLPLCWASAQAAHGFFSGTPFQRGRLCPPTHRHTSRQALPVPTRTPDQDRPHTANTHPRPGPAAHRAPAGQPTSFFSLRSTQARARQLVVPEAAHSQRRVENGTESDPDSRPLSWKGPPPRPQQDWTASARCITTSHPLFSFLEANLWVGTHRREDDSHGRIPGGAGPQDPFGKQLATGRLPSPSGPSPSLLMAKCVTPSSGPPTSHPMTVSIISLFKHPGSGSRK